MKRIALLAVIGAGLMALPSTAAAQSGATKCPTGAEVRVLGTQVVYVCVWESTTGAGGELVVNDSDSCSYINGWSTNPGTPGYAGICTAATPDPACDTIDNGSGANEGGCFYIKPTGTVINNAVTAMFICGNTSGEDPKASNRDGCGIP